MSDELPIAGKTYVSSKRAATVTGYTQDYIGQLARGGQIEAQRVGGLWYVFLDSLTGYKANSDAIKPQPPQAPPSYDPESVVSFDGKDYVSASRAAKITGYNQDYIGQLARSGKILSRQIGNRWYVERSGLLTHKNDKDRLLAAVQVESVGLARKSQETPYTAATAPLSPQQDREMREYANAGPVLTYFQEERHDLIPFTAKDRTPAVSTIKIRTLAPKQVQAPIRSTKKEFVLDESNQQQKNRSRLSDSSINIATKSLAAFTVVVVLSYGLFSLKDSSMYATIMPSGVSAESALSHLAGAAQAIGTLGDTLERLLTTELVYIRTPGTDF